MSTVIAGTPLLLLEVFGCISLVCSFFTLFLIYSMKRWNDFLKLIVCLTIAQAFYDVSIIAFPATNTELEYNLDLFVNCASGLAKVLW